MDLEGYLPASAICAIEGCDFGVGGACRRCDARLRCPLCGRYERVDSCENHYATKHEPPRRVAYTEGEWPSRKKAT